MKRQEHLSQTGNKIVGHVPSLPRHVLKNDSLISLNDGLTLVVFLCTFFHVNKDVLQTKEKKGEQR